MKNKMTHFAIHIDDIERAKKFYDGVFDWGFKLAWNALLALITWMTLWNG